jgi:hypothetical protein
MVVEKESEEAMLRHSAQAHKQNNGREEKTTREEEVTK